MLESNRNLESVQACVNRIFGFPLDIICSSDLTVFLKLHSRKTVRFSEQIMSADKYPSIVSRQMEAIVFIILQIFFATRVVCKLGNIF